MFSICIFKEIFSANTQLFDFEQNNGFGLLVVIDYLADRLDPLLKHSSNRNNPLSTKEQVGISLKCKTAVENRLLLDVELLK